MLLSTVHPSVSPVTTRRHPAPQVTSMSAHGGVRPLSGFILKLAAAKFAQYEISRKTIANCFVHLNNFELLLGPSARVSFDYIPGRAAHLPDAASFPSRW